jgi:cytochrome c556
MLATSGSFAQVTAEAFMGKIPSLPNNPCSLTSIEKGEFRESVDVVIKQLQAEIDKLQNENEQFMEDNADKMRDNMARQMGASPADMAKLQKGEDMSDEEAMKMANNILGNTMNLSMGEIDNLKNMSEEGKQAWANAYGTEMMADAQANPQKYKANQQKGKNLYDLVQEQQLLMQQLNAKAEKFSEQFREIENDPDNKTVLENIHDWTTEYFGMAGVDYGQGPKMDALATKIKSAKIAYCNKNTDKYLGILSEYKNYVVTNLGEYNRLEKLVNETTELQTGVKNTSPQGLMALSSLMGYLRKYESVLQYSLWDAENPF